VQFNGKYWEKPRKWSARGPRFPGQISPPPPRRSCRVPTSGPPYFVRFRGLTEVLRLARHIHSLTEEYQSREQISETVSLYLTKFMHKICFTISFISCLYMFGAHVLIIKKSKLHYTASGIITLTGGCPDGTGRGGGESGPEDVSL